MWQAVNRVARHREAEQKMSCFLTSQACANPSWAYLSHSPKLWVLGGQIFGTRQSACVGRSHHCALPGGRVVNVANRCRILPRKSRFTTEWAFEALSVYIASLKRAISQEKGGLSENGRQNLRSRMIALKSVENSGVVCGKAWENLWRECGFRGEN